MENSVKYKFDHFTLAKYEVFLGRAKERYTFRSYSEFASTCKHGTALWRHDVDFSPEYALKIARIDQKFGVSSAFFVLCHSEFYNPFEPRTRDTILEILDCGCRLGIHFDASFYNAETDEDLVRFLRLERSIFETIFRTEVSTFSFHNPTPRQLEFNSLYYAGLINTYATLFSEKVAYCSDSNGYWRHNALPQFLEEQHDSIQVLTHPEWWQEEIKSPKQKIEYLIERRASQCIETYEELLRNNQRKNIDWL